MHTNMDKYIPLYVIDMQTHVCLLKYIPKCIYQYSIIYMHIYVYIHSSITTYICVKYICLCTYLHTYMPIPCLSTYMYTYIHTHVFCMHGCNMSINVHTHMPAYIYPYAYLNVYINMTYFHAYIDTYMTNMCIYFLTYAHTCPCMATNIHINKYTQIYNICITFR